MKIFWFLVMCTGCGPLYSSGERGYGGAPMMRRLSPQKPAREQAPMKRQMISDPPREDKRPLITSGHC